MPANLETHQWQRTGKGQFSFQSQRKAMPKNPQTTAQNINIVKNKSKNTIITKCSVFLREVTINAITVNEK